MSIRLLSHMLSCVIVALIIVVCNHAEACFNDSGRQSLLQEVQAILQGVYSFLELQSFVDIYQVFQ
jgi:hypothetical protein